MTAPTTTTADAYTACEEVTRTQARNFHYGIRLLPTPKRNALCALYALARRIDDIGDGDLPLEEKHAALGRVRKELGHLEQVDDPVYVAVADAARRFPVPLGAFDELLDGVERDLGEVRIVDFDDLVEYCRCVAGSVGRLCLSVFGTRDSDVDLETLSRYADQLGIALQQTNILRDIREDLGNDRIYLPGDELDRFGVRLVLDQHGHLDDPRGRLAGYIGFAAARAQDWYSLGWRLLPHLDWRAGASCRAMSGIYHHLLVRIAADPVLVYDRRLSLSGAEKARVAVGSLAGARP
jgi:phytoene synthase